MKRYSIIAVAVIAIATALTAFGLTRWIRPASNPDEMTWLREEFSLTPDQVATIRKLHAAYEPVCADHCDRIATAREHLQVIAQGGQIDSPEYLAAKRDWEALRNECAEATRHHLESVAAAMSPDQGRRYLEMIGPKVDRHQHERPFGLQ